MYLNAVNIICKTLKQWMWWHLNSELISVWIGLLISQNKQRERRLVGFGSKSSFARFCQINASSKFCWAWKVASWFVFISSGLLKHLPPPGKYFLSLQEAWKERNCGLGTFWFCLWLSRYKSWMYPFLVQTRSRCEVAAPFCREWRASSIRLD